MNEPRGLHDVGGLPAGPVERSEHTYGPWERRVDALNILMSARGVYTTDASRRIKEQLPEEAYENLTYYERWVAGLGNLLLERGVITSDELARKMIEVEGRYKAAGGRA
jgi:hypothetical protein